MEQNLPIISKKLWNIIRLAFFMLRKGINKKKILLDLNLMMERGKTVGKAALNNLIFHHYNLHAASTSHGGVGEPFPLQPATMDEPREYEFSCSNTPLYRQYFTNKKKNNHYNQKYYYMPSPKFEDMLETMFSNKDHGVRQLRITDSPFPLQNEEVCDKHVDEAAEEFIKRFYSQLKKQEC